MMTDRLSLFCLNGLNTFSSSAEGRGAQPTGTGDYIIVIISVLVVLVAFYLCVKYFFRPGEKQDNHIKNMIFDDDPAGRKGDMK
jgi:cbb3-type cytochrome oxidase subunit 3